MKTELFDVTEDDVAKRLGLTRENVRELRVAHLYQDEDFAMIGRAIHYAATGIEKLRQIIKKNAPAGVKPRDLSMPRIKDGSAATSASIGIYLASRKGEGILDAIVKEIYPKNPKYLMAILGDKEITVHVNSNVNFIKGMVIESRQLVMKNERVFEFNGRCPRARGKW